MGQVQCHSMSASWLPDTHSPAPPASERTTAGTHGASRAQGNEVCCEDTGFTEDWYPCGLRKMASLNLDRFFCPVSPVISISHFLTCCKCQMRTYVKLNKVTQLCPTLWDPMDCSPPGPSIHEYFPGKNTRVGCHSLLQGIFPTKGTNLGHLHCRQILYRLSQLGSPVNIMGESSYVFLLHQWQRCKLSCVELSQPSMEQGAGESDVFEGPW